MFETREDDSNTECDSQEKESEVIVSIESKFFFKLVLS